MTLQQAKDQVAKRYCTVSGKQFKNWALMEKHFSVSVVDDVSILVRRIEEASELYAKSIAEKAWEAGTSYGYNSGRGYDEVPDKGNKETFMKQLFPEK